MSIQDGSQTEAAPVPSHNARCCLHPHRGLDTRCGTGGNAGGAEPTPGKRGSFFVPGAGFEPPIFAYGPEPGYRMTRENARSACSEAIFGSSHFALLTVA